MAKRNRKHRRNKPPAKQPKTALQKTKGRYFDLLEIYDAVNRRYFNGKIKARISWGRKLKIPQRRHKMIKIGLCYVAKRLIIIHRALDRFWVPRFIIEFTVFHEILHIKHPPRRKNGHNDFHYAEFMAAEKNFADYAKAVRWEQNNLTQLRFF